MTPLPSEVDVGPVSVLRGLTVEEDPERDRSSPGRRPHDEVDIAGVEPERDPSAGFVQHRSVPCNRPRPREPPVVEGQLHGRRVPSGSSYRATSPAQNPRSARSPCTSREIGASASRRPPRARPGRRHQILIHVFHARVHQELLDHHLDRGVLTLAEVVVADPSVDIGDVHGRPEVVREGAPDRVVVVERDRILDLEVARGRDDVVDVVLESELRRMYPDDGQAGIRVFRRPGPDVGKRAEPVDAGVGPEVDEDDAPAEPLRRQRLGVEPPGRAVERCQVALDREGELLARRPMGDRADQAAVSATARATSWQHPQEETAGKAQLVNVGDMADSFWPWRVGGPLRQHESLG